MAQDKYYFLVNDAVCCQLHLYIHDNSHPLYSQRQQYQPPQHKDQQLQDLYIQQRASPRFDNVFPAIPGDISKNAKLSPPLTLDIAATGETVLYPYSTTNSAATATAASHTISDQNHQRQRYETHGVASSRCPPMDISTVSQLAAATQDNPCPNVVYSYDGASESFSTLLRDKVNNVLLPGPNATWEDIRQIASNYSSMDSISVLCSPPSDSADLTALAGNSPGIFVNSILNVTSAAVTSAETYTSNVSSLLQNLSDVNFSIVSKDDYLQMYLGKRYLSSAAMLALMSIYSIIFFTGVLGNLCTCLVIARNRFLHTATNYYLFSLAISDVLTLLLGK